MCVRHNCLFLSSCRNGVVGVKDNAHCSGLGPRLALAVCACARDGRRHTTAPHDIDSRHKQSPHSVTSAQHHGEQVFLVVHVLFYFLSFFMQPWEKENQF